MSLTELIPLVNNLNLSDRLSLFKLLAAQIPDAELQTVFIAPEYPIWSSYESIDAANALMQMVQDDREMQNHHV